MTGSVEVVYRGIFQKTLGQRITRGVVLAAVKEGKVGLSFGRYGDSPERNGIPAKSFAVVADNEEELQAYLSRYEPSDNDVTVAVDDTLCKGVESWAWDGLQPINKLTRPGGTVLATSMQTAEELLVDCHRKETEWKSYDHGEHGFLYVERGEDGQYHPDETQIEVVTDTINWLDRYLKPEELTSR